MQKIKLFWILSHSTQLHIKEAQQCCLNLTPALNLFPRQYSTSNRCKHQETHGNVECIHIKPSFSVGFRYILYLADTPYNYSKTWPVGIVGMTFAKVECKVHRSLDCNYRRRGIIEVKVLR